MNGEVHQRRMNVVSFCLCRLFHSKKQSRGEAKRMARSQRLDRYGGY